MKTATSELLTVGAWGLHLGSFIMASMPYLQAFSLILAIAVSIFTLRKMIRESNEKRKKKNEKVF
jgi:ABC-type nickel/cobalt efflux system permease component RcnA